MAVALECRNLSFRYQDRPVLDRISFSAAPGTFYALLGKNGSGKTTLLHCLSNVLSPGGGDILINGISTSAMTRKEIAQNISLVPQEHGERFPFTVLDVVVMGRAPFLGIAEAPGDNDYRLAEKTLDTLEAGHLKDCRYNRISGGERQLTALAAALVQSDRIMLLDEPTNHLDFNRQYHFLETIRCFCRDRQTTAIASIHDPNLAMLFADQVIMIDGGRITAQGPTRDIMTETAVSALYGFGTRQVPMGKNTFLFLPAGMIRSL